MTPFLGVQDGQNVISWRWSLPSPTDPVWWRLMHTILSYRGNRTTHTQIHTQTNLRQDRLQYIVLLSLARSVINVKYPQILTHKSHVSTVPNIQRRSLTECWISGMLSNSHRILTALKYVEMGRPHLGCHIASRSKLHRLSKKTRTPVIFWHNLIKTAQISIILGLFCVQNMC